MNKYYYAECPLEYWPEIKSISAKSYNDAVERLINKYATEFEDDNIFKCDDFESLRDYLNSNFTIALSDLEIIDEL